MRKLGSWKCIQIKLIPLSLVIVILFSQPVLLSTAVTFRMPLKSRSKVTQICGTPRGAGGIPLSSNLPRMLLSLVMARSPSKTWISTPGWLSEYVVNVCVCFVGIVVLRLISDVITPPAVSIPRESGATSNKSRSCTASDLSPCKIAAWTATTSNKTQKLIIQYMSEWHLSSGQITTKCHKN